MTSIRISNVRFWPVSVNVDKAASGSVVQEEKFRLANLQVSPTPGAHPMSELENKLNHILEEHQHESGLHMIGGRRRLIDRLVRFFEEDMQQTKTAAPTTAREN